MTFALVAVLVIIAVATILFITEWVSFDVTALLILAALLLTGVLPPERALSGFSNPATITIAAMLVLSAGLERTGVLGALSDGIELLADRGPRAAFGALLLCVGLVSAFVNNTAVVALFIPVVLRVSERLGTNPSRLLMPLSFVSIFGGVCTLVGTSTNLVVSGLLRAEGGHEQIGMFELAPVGVILFMVGFIYCLLASPLLLKGRRSREDLTRRFAMSQYLSDVSVGEGFSRKGGETVEELTRRLDVDVLRVLRDGRALSGSGLLMPGDVLRVRASPQEIVKLVQRDDLHIGAPRDWSDPDLAQGDVVLVEAILAPDTAPVGRTVDQSRLRERYQAHVLAVRQRGRLRKHDLGEVQLRGGDSLLLQIPRRRLDGLRRSRAFVVVSELPTPDVRASRAPIALLAIAGAVALAAAGVVPIVASAAGAVVLLLLTRTLTPDEMYGAINWKVLVLLAGVIPLGEAMERTGAAHLLGEQLVRALDGAAPVIAVGAIFGVTVLLTNIMSNVAAAALLVPVAISAAGAMEVNPRTLVMAVTFGASLSFLSPIGYQTNTLVYGPGDYRFADFFKLGLPLTVLCVILVSLLVPVVWPP